MRNVSLYLDNDLIELAKLKGLNISQEVNNFLKIRLDVDLDIPKDDKKLKELKKLKEEELLKVRGELNGIKKIIEDKQKEEDSHILKEIIIEQ